MMSLVAISKLAVDCYLDFAYDQSYCLHETLEYIKKYSFSRS